MAGIGFELRKIFEKDSVHGRVMGILYASMTTIGPTIVFLLLLLGIGFILDVLRVPETEQIFFSSACLYLFIMATILSGSLNTINARFISDRIFEKEEEYISSSMFGTVFITSILSAAILFVFCTLLYFRYHISIGFLVGYYLFGIMIANTYSIMTFISAIKEYRKITKAFFIGILWAVISFLFVYFLMKIPALNSIIYSLGTGFLIINLMLIYYIITFFEFSNKHYFAFMKYYKQYPMLFLSGLFYVIGLYISNIIYWFFSDISIKVTIFHVAPTYDMATFLAVLANLSATVIFVVKIETQFFERYKEYVTALNSGNYSIIEKSRKNMDATISIQLFFIYEMQLIITIIVTCLAVLFFPRFGVGGLTLDFFLLLNVAFYCIFSMYSTVVFLYYFKDQLGSCLTTGIFLSVTILVTILALKLGIGYYALSPLIGALTAWIFGFVRLKYILKDINAKIFCYELQ